MIPCNEFWIKCGQQIKPIDKDFNPHLQSYLSMLTSYSTTLLIRWKLPEKSEGDKEEIQVAEAGSTDGKATNRLSLELVAHSKRRGVGLAFVFRFPFFPDCS